MEQFTEGESTREEIKNKLRQNFDGKIVRKDLTKKIKEGAKQPKVCPFHCIKTCDISKSPYCIITALYNAFKGNMENGYAFAGANAFKATRIMSVKETFRSLLEEFNRK